MNQQNTEGAASEPSAQTMDDGGHGPSAQPQGVVIPAGYTPTIAAGNLRIGFSPGEGFFTQLMKPLDLLLLEETEEQFGRARSITQDSPRSRNLHRRALACCLLLLHAALQARAFRILSERYQDSGVKIKQMGFNATWDRALNIMSRDSRLTMGGDAKLTK